MRMSAPLAALALLLPSCLCTCPTDVASIPCLAQQFSISQAEVEEVVRKVEEVGHTQEWLQAILTPRRTLLVIDMQNDFITGSLAVGGAEDILAPLQALIEADTLWDKIVFSADWHPSDHISFFSNLHLRALDPQWRANHPGNITMFQEVVFAREPPYSQVLWPDHCVEGSPGSSYHPLVTRPQGSLEIRKGTNPEVDSYSAFFDNTGVPDSGSTGLAEMVAGSTEIVVVGLATDYCVGSTSLHSLQQGFPTTLLEDLARPVSQDSGNQMLDRVMASGGWVEASGTWRESLHSWNRARRFSDFWVSKSTATPGQFVSTSTSSAIGRITNISLTVLVLCYAY